MTVIWISGKALVTLLVQAAAMISHLAHLLRTGSEMNLDETIFKTHYMPNQYLEVEMAKLTQKAFTRSLLMLIQERMPRLHKWPDKQN